MNPEAPFDEPWQARLCALTQGVIENGVIDREEFRQGLIAAIGEAPERPYWESWLVAFESAAGARSANLDPSGA